MAWFFSWLITFALTQYYYFLSSMIGIHGYFIIFGVACFCVAMFALFMLPETHGKTLAEVQQLMGLGAGADISKNYVPEGGKIHLARY